MNTERLSIRAELSVAGSELVKRLESQTGASRAAILEAGLLLMVDMTLEDVRAAVAERQKALKNDRH